MTLTPPTPIASPPWTQLGKKLESLTRKAVNEYDLFSDLDPLKSNKKIAIALSGGKDSLTLLYLLKALSGRGFPPFEIHAIHVAGEFSCGAGIDANYIKNICHQLDVTLHIKESYIPLESLECYSCSRNRRKLIFDTAKSVGATTIAFGHHRDDSNETLLMNLLQKGEFAGNLPKVPMHVYKITIIRPLILISEKQIIEFSKQYNFHRIMCQCPVGQNSMRKNVKTLIDELAEYFPHAKNNLAKATQKYGSDKATRR